MKLIENTMKIFKKQTKLNKVLFILAIIYLILATILVFSTIGWWTVFTSIALSIVINMWSKLSEEIENKQFNDDKDNKETH